MNVAEMVVWYYCIKKGEIRFTFLKVLMEMAF